MNRDSSFAPKPAGSTAEPAQVSGALMPSVVSINVGRPREVIWKGRTVTTSIFKSPVSGPVTLRRHNLDGDEQADLSVHGGPTKAVYAYPAEHYAYWRETLRESDLTWGCFGENLTVSGLDENTVYVGDEFRVGSALLVATEPRMPCSKLALRFRRPEMVKLFLRSQRTGFYFGVVEEGVLQAGDPSERVREHPDRLSIAEVTRLYTTEKDNRALLRKAVRVTALSENWRNHFLSQLEGLAS